MDRAEFHSRNFGVLAHYHYISFHGLAYKRIGVIVSCYCTGSLVTLFLKVRDRKSFFYVARLNTWALFVTLVGSACVVGIRSS